MSDPAAEIPASIEKSGRLDGPPPASATIDLLGLDLGDITRLLQPLGGGAQMAGNLLRSLYRDQPAEVTELRDVRPGVLEALARRARIGRLTLARELAAGGENDPARKYVLRAEDGREIETVSIPARDRLTVCVSSQIGCRMGCTFCQTGQMGLIRNLAAGEIVGQVLFVRDRLRPGRRITNVVFMGMGEPTDNVDAVLAAVRVLSEQRGLAIPRKRITLSSVGNMPGLERLAQLGIPLTLAISLNASEDVTRSEIMPVNRPWPIESLLAFTDRFPLRPGREVLFEYVLLAGVNDTDEDADRLAALLAPRRAKVNVIAYNPVPGLPYDRPTPERVEQFAARLAAHGVWTTIRASRGTDVMGACGQLGKTGE